jgi:NAD(P)-dependent dehydrogenase (short-subunit alcohol dehydrogenase family)
MDVYIYKVEISHEKGEVNMREFDISGRVAVVTGGSKGIGYGIAKDLADGGANVVVVSRHLNEAEAAADEVRRRGREGLAISADVQNPGECEQLVRKTVESFSRLDILINNAGTNIRKPLLEYTEAEWDAILDTNLKGLFFCSQFAAREMRKQEKGRIVNISSVGAQLAAPFLGPYCASKGGITQLTKVCALEWAQYNITVNAIGPYYIKTPLTEEWVSDPARHEKILSRTAIQRLGEPEDLSRLLILLASDASSYITGQTFYVDGGALAGWTDL